MLRPEHMLADGQGLLVKGLGLQIEAVEIQKFSGLVEQPSCLRKLQLELGNEHRALLDVGYIIVQVILLVFAGAGASVWKSGIDGPYDALCPGALAILIHTILEHD